MQNVKDLLEFYQESMLEDIFGDMTNNRSEVTTPWCCPKCASDKGFRRRGSRNKKVYYNEEKIDIRLFQVTCLKCDSTFSPFPEILGLERNERLYGDMFDFNHLKLARNI